MGAVIRELGPDDDLEALTELLHRAYAGLARRNLLYVATHQSVAVTRSRISKGTCFVAELDGRLAGTLTYVDPARTAGCEVYDRPGVASFHQFGVEPALQGRGIGDLLLARAGQAARADGARALALDTAEPARQLIAMYRRRGYRVEGHADWPETNYRSVIMVRSLEP